MEPGNVEIKKPVKTGIKEKIQRFIKPKRTENKGRGDVFSSLKEDHELNAKERVQMQLYLKDIAGAANVQEALDLLRSGKVNENIVRVWVERGTADGDYFEAIRAGYPQFEDLFRTIEANDTNIAARKKLESIVQGK